MKVGVVGSEGYVGQAYCRMFPDAASYDEPQGIGDREEINKCDIAIVAVPTNLESGGPPYVLDMSIVKDVVEWLETPLILIKSALMPGTVDRLVESTGKKIAVSVELVGMGGYHLPPEYPHPKDPAQHRTLIIGGELDTATRCAEILWERMSPDTRIHLLSAREAEVCKLVENAYLALKVTFANCLREFVMNSGGNFIRVQQAWTSDARVGGTHLRALEHKRGWNSHCWNKDILALVAAADEVDAEGMALLMETVYDINRQQTGEL